MFILSNSATWCCVANRNRPTSLFMSADVSPVSSSSDRANVQLQGYHKTYNHQQVFSQQQGTDKSPPNTCQHQQPQHICMTFVFCCSLRFPLWFFQGCLYGEGKVVQPVSDGGFEPASYFTTSSSSSSHSTGKTAQCFFAVIGQMCGVERVSWVSTSDS